jgi:hypothetical protein
MFLTYLLLMVIDRNTSIFGITMRRSVGDVLLAFGIIHMDRFPTERSGEREKKRPIPFGLGRGGRSRHGVGVRRGGPAAWQWRFPPLAVPPSRSARVWSGVAAGQ